MSNLAIHHRQFSDCHRIDLQRLAAHQQKAMDQFVFSVYGRSGFRVVRDVRLVDRRIGLPACCQAACNHGYERNSHLHGFGVSAQRYWIQFAGIPEA